MNSNDELNIQSVIDGAWMSTFITIVTILTVKVIEQDIQCPFDSKWALAGLFCNILQFIFALISTVIFAASGKDYSERIGMAAANIIFGILFYLIATVF